MNRETLPKLTIEYWPASRIKPYENNPRKNDPHVDAIVASITEYGFAIPLLAVGATGELIDGHLRYKGGLKLEMAEFPVIPCDGWSESQIRAFRLMVNRSVAWSQWDIEKLQIEFAQLKVLDFQLPLTGFSTREIDGFITPAAIAAEDVIPAKPEVATAAPGDVWLLGPHRLMCGDSTDKESVSRLLNFTKPFLMVTDPPYGVNYDSDWRLKSGINKSHQHLADGKVSNDNRDDWRDAWALFPGTVAYVWHGALHAGVVIESLVATGFTPRAQIIWAKKSLVIGRGHYHWQHEPCWYAARGSAHWSGDRKQSTLWAIENMHSSQGNVDDGKTNHSTQKPVECMRRPILNHTAPGDLVYEPFAGSGTTLVAAELTERVCYAMELDPLYVDMIVTTVAESDPAEGDARRTRWSHVRTGKIRAPAGGSGRHQRARRGAFGATSMNEYMKILGRNVEDSVTGFAGVVTSVGFDLYGCVQCIVTPSAKDGKQGESGWFDHKRLLVVDHTPVMPIPSFENVAGPESKPPMKGLPIR